MKPTKKQVLAFVEAAGGLEVVQTALVTGSKTIKAQDEALTVAKAELEVAVEANEGLQTKLDEATSTIETKDKVLESKAKQRKSGSLFKKPVDEGKGSKKDPRNSSLTMRLINQNR